MITAKEFIEKYGEAALGDGETVVSALGDFTDAEQKQVVALTRKISAAISGKPVVLTWVTLMAISWRIQELLIENARSDGKESTPH